MIDQDYIEVVFVSETQSAIVKLPYKQMTVEQAIERSNILKTFSEIELSRYKVGVYSSIVKLSYKLKPNDRVEIYRPLVIDPKNARRMKAQISKNNKR